MRLHQVMAGGALALALGVALPASAAGPFGRDFQYRPYAQQQRPQQGTQPQRDADRRTQPQRDAGQADRGRLSPEDRRQLRRDINDAGRDIYRGQGNGRVPPQRQDQRQRRGR